MDELTAILRLAARLQEGGPGSGRHPEGGVRDKCFACNRPISGKPNNAITHDGQRVQVGNDCAKRIQKMGKSGGYQPPLGGPKLLPHSETVEGGPGSGRHPEGGRAPSIRGGKNKMIVPGGHMKVSDVTYHIADPRKGLSMCGRGGKGGGPSQNTVVVPGGAKPSVADLNKVGCPRCLAKYTARNYRASEAGDLHGTVAAVEHSPDYGTFVIPPIDPDQKHARESFASFIERKTEEYGTSAGASAGWDTRGRGRKPDKLDRTIRQLGGQMKSLSQGKPNTATPQKAGAPSVRDVAKYWSGTKHGGTLNAPKFTGQSKVGVSHLNKMNVMSRAQGQSIFSKAGHDKGFK